MVSREGTISTQGLSNTTRLSAGLGAAAMSAGAAVVAFNDPSKATFFPVCPLLTLTGFACPGCGLTRGFHALFNGDLVTALDFNLLLPLWAALFGWILLSLILMAIRGKGLRMPAMTGKTVWIASAVLVVFGVLRNLPWYPLTILYP
jgi:hypothetical protein